jgi:hypothetical protein
MANTEKTVTLGRVLLSNLVLPFVAAYLYWRGTPLSIVIESCLITFAVINVWFLVAFWIWGKK